MSLRDQLHDEADDIEAAREQGHQAVLDIVVPVVRKALVEDAPAEAMIVAAIVALEDGYLADATTRAMHSGAVAVEKRREASRA